MKREYLLFQINFIKNEMACRVVCIHFNNMKLASYQREKYINLCLQVKKKNGIFPPVFRAASCALLPSPQATVAIEKSLVIIHPPCHVRHHGIAHFSGSGKRLIYPPELQIRKIPHKPLTLAGDTQAPAHKCVALPLRCFVSRYILFFHIFLIVSALNFMKHASFCQALFTIKQHLEMLNF